MNRIIYVLLAVAVLFAPTSCSDITDTNIDPTRLSEVNLSLMAPIVLSGHYRNIGSNPGRVAGIIMQQYNGTDAQQIEYSAYILGRDAMNNYWRTGLYAGPLKDAQVMIDRAIEEGNAFYEGLGKLIFATALADAASYFGDIPYSEALRGTESLQPAYDSQEDVYDSALNLLDEAISALEKDNGGHFGGDLVYDGDADAWIKTAKALKARYLMQLQKRRDVASEVLSLISESFGSVGEEPRFAFSTAQTSNWTLAKFGRERPNTLVIDNRFADMMEAAADPRKPYYMKFDGTVWQYWVLGDDELRWAVDDANVPLISYSELMFLRAEALLRTSAATADVEDALAAAIQASMDLLGIPAADATTYVDANSTLSGSFNADLEKIMTEAYVAYYGHNFSQTWANFRRTGYPNLTPNPQGSNGFNPGGVVPRRYLYPDSEYQTNADNVEAAAARQNGALLDVPVWAFQ